VTGTDHENRLPSRNRLHSHELAAALDHIVAIIAVLRKELDILHHLAQRLDLRLRTSPRVLVQELFSMLIIEPF
jgi:hypothetical protein